ncbi:hypothetical protein [Clostridium sp. JNZ J1-5]
MSKKSVVTILIFIITLCGLICFLGYKNMNSKIAAKGGVKTKNLFYTLADNNGRSEYSYSIELINTNGKTIFIKTIEPSVNETVKNKILSKETLVTVNKKMSPNETIQVNGEIIVDTHGLSAQDIQKFITDIKVSTEETVNLK